MYMRTNMALGQVTFPDSRAPLNPPPRPLTEREVMLVAKSAGDLWGDKLGNIDVFAQKAIVRLSNNPWTAADAHELLDAVRSRELRGIFIENQKVPALRAQKLGTWYGKLIPAGEDAVVVPAPIGSTEPPLIAFRDSIKTNPARLDPALVKVRRKLLPQITPAHATVRVVSRPRSDTHIVAVGASGKVLMTLGEGKARREGDFLVFDLPSIAASARLLVINARGVLDLQRVETVSGIGEDIVGAAPQQLRIDWPKRATKILEREFFEGAEAAIKFEPSGSAIVKRGGRAIDVPADATSITLTVQVPKLRMFFSQTFLVDSSSGSLQLTPFRTKQPNGTLPPWALHPRLEFVDTTLPGRLPVLDIDTDILDITSLMLADPKNPTLRQARAAYDAEIFLGRRRSAGHFVLLQDTRVGGLTWGAYISPAARDSLDLEMALMFRHEVTRCWDTARQKPARRVPTGFRDIDYKYALMHYLLQTAVRPGSFITQTSLFDEYHHFGWGEQLDRAAVPVVLLLPIPFGVDFGSLEGGAEGAWNTIVKVQAALLAELRLGSAKQLSPPKAPRQMSLAGWSSGTDTVHKWVRNLLTGQSAIRHVDRVILFDGKKQTIPDDDYRKWFRGSADRKLVLVTGWESRSSYPKLAKSVATVERKATQLVPDEGYWERDPTYAQAFAPICWVDEAGRPKEFRLDPRPSHPPPTVPNRCTVKCCDVSVSPSLNLYKEREAPGGTIVASAFIGGKWKTRAMALSSCEMAGYTAYVFRLGGRVSSSVDFALLQRDAAAFGNFGQYPNNAGEREPIRRCRHTWTVIGGTRSEAGTFEGFLAQALRT